MLGQDLAVLTGGQLITEELGLKLEDVKAEMLGSAKQITITKDDTLVLGGAGAVADVEERCAMIRDQVSQTTSEYEKEKLQVSPLLRFPLACLGLSFFRGRYDDFPNVYVRLPITHEIT